MTPTLGDLFLISGKVSWLCPSVNEGAGGAQDFQLQQDFVVCFFFFFKKKVLCGNEWDNDKNKHN